MGLSAYFDGSGKNDAVTKVLTLAGFAAPEKNWAKFKVEWKGALNKNGVESFHMSDAMTLNGQFDCLKGWNESKVRNLLKDLFNVLGNFRTVHFEAYSCSVVLNDYSRAKNIVPKLRPPEALCVNFCVGGLQLKGEDFDTPKPIKLYFDRNEGFLKTVYGVWDHAKNKSKTKGWPKQIDSILPVSSKTCYPIQAADMLAWMVNRHCTRPEENNAWYLQSFLLADHYSKIYDYNEIVAEYANG